MWTLVIALAHADLTDLSTATWNFQAACDVSATCGADAVVDTCFVPAGGSLKVCKAVRKAAPEHVCERTITGVNGDVVGTAHLYCGSGPKDGMCAPAGMCTRDVLDLCVTVPGASPGCSTLRGGQELACGAGAARVVCTLGRTAPEPAKGGVPISGLGVLAGLGLLGLAGRHSSDQAKSGGRDASNHGA